MLTETNQLPDWVVQKFRLKAQKKNNFITKSSLNVINNRQSFKSRILSQTRVSRWPDSRLPPSMPVNGIRSPNRYSDAYLIDPFRCLAQTWLSISMHIHNLLSDFGSIASLIRDPAKSSEMFF